MSRALKRLQTIHELRAGNERLLEQNKQLRGAANFVGLNYMRLLDIVEFDAVTGLLSRHSWSERVTGILTSEPPEDDRRTYHPESFGIIFADLDRFKQINDKHGHKEGDRILNEVARNMRLRGDDTCAIPTRWGGEEIIITVPWADLDGTLQIAERIRTSIQSDVMSPNGVPVTASFGVAIGSTREVSGRGLDAIGETILQADLAMYVVKNAGRNGVAFYNTACETFERWQPAEAVNIT